MSNTPEDDPDLEEEGPPDMTQYDEKGRMIVDAKGYDVVPAKGRGYRPNPPRPITHADCVKFLDELATHGIISLAAKRARLHSNTGSLTSWKRLRNENPDFAAAWDEALQIARDNVEAELHRRAVDGVQKKVWFQGQEVGEETVYSDSLLLARMKALDHRYRAKHIEVDQKVTIEPLGFEQMSPEQRELMRQLLESGEDTKQISVPKTPQITISETDDEDPLDQENEDE